MERLVRNALCDNKVGCIALAWSDQGEGLAFGFQVTLNSSKMFDRIGAVITGGVHRRDALGQRQEGYARP